MRESVFGAEPDQAAVEQVAAARLRPYVSPLLYRRADAPATTHGAIAQIDIGRFTATVEKYSQRGPLALEGIAELIGRCFGTLVETVGRHGGWVHTFPGDSVIAVWESSEGALHEAVRLALACCAELARIQLTDERLPLKAGIGAGHFSLQLLGGQGERRELFVTGDAVVQMGAALAAVDQGQVVLSAAARRRAPGHIDGRMLKGGGFRVAMPLPEIALVRASASRPTGAGPTAPEVFLPSVLRERLRGGLADWIGELRTASIVFAYLDPGDAAAGIDYAPAFVAVQAAMTHFGGSVVQFCHDDKGVVALMAIGVDEAHEDDADRALAAALAIHAALRDLGHAGDVGVTTGRIYCGLLGGGDRLEYRLIGNAVNLAARLMGKGRGVLCDEATRRRARRCRFDATERLSIKGWSQPVVVYTPRAPAAPATLVTPPFTAAATPPPTCGRAAELAAASAWLGDAGGAAAHAAHNPLLAILGEAGIGKTHLARHVAHAAERQGHMVIVYQNDQIGANSALRPYRVVLDGLFDLRDAGAEARRDVLLRAVDSALGSTELAPLLEDVYPVGLVDNAATRQLEGAARADNRLDLLARVLRFGARAARRGVRPCIVFLEDAHWMDAPSWAVLQVLAAEAEADARLRFVLTARTMPPEVPGALALLNGEHSSVIRVGPLERAEIENLVLMRLQADHVTPQLLDLMCRQTSGNPLFCEELLRALRAQGLVVVEQRRARLAASPEVIAQVVPESIEMILKARIDRLPATRQLTLKCASVLGVHFSMDLLRSIHPLEDYPDLEADLTQLVEDHLIEPRGGNAPGCYEFRHATIREVAYAGLLLSQRRQLHATVARKLTERFAATSSDLEIFHHWCAAADSRQALEYVERGGHDAWRQGNYQAAREFFAFGVQSIAGLDDPNDSRTLRWSQRLGEVEVALGRHAAARGHLEAALGRLGRRAPRSLVAAGMAVVVESLRQLAYRYRRTARRGDADGQAALHGAAIYEQLGYVYYASGDTLRGIHAALCLLNLAERGPLAPICARAYAAMSLTVSVTRLRRLGDYYEQAARAAAACLDDAAVAGWVSWIAALRAAGEARWPALFDDTSAALAAAERGSDRRLAIMASLTRAWGLRVHGEHAEARAMARRALSIARSHGNHLWEAWALLAEAECDLAEQAHEAAVKASQRALDILAEESDRTEEIRAGGILASALLALGHETRARRMAATTTRLMRRVDLTTFVMLEGFAGVTEVYIRLYEQAAAGDARGRRRLRRQAHAACVALHRYADVFVVAGPRYWRLQGQLLAARRKPRRAAAAFARAVAEAERLDLSHECVLARRALRARPFPSGDDEQAAAAAAPPAPDASGADVAERMPD